MDKKRILIFNGSGALNFMRIAYARVFNQLGYEVQMYNPEDPNRISVLDFFKKFEPNTLFIGSYQIDRATKKAILQRPDLEVILWTPNYGEMDDEIDYEQDGVLRASEDEIRNVEQIKSINNSLQNCFTYYHQNWVGKTHDKWRNIGLEPVGIPLAADMNDYSFGEYQPALACDISYIGGWWEFKAQNMRKYLLPLCNREDLNIKLFGWGDYPVAQHIGPIATENAKFLFASTKVCPNVFEPLVKYGFDHNERTFKVLSNGGFVVSQYSETGKNDLFTNNEVVFTESPDDFIEKILYYVKNPTETIPFRERGLEYAYLKGTYFHRARELASTLGWFEAAIKLDQILENIKNYLPQAKELMKNNLERISK
jgi:hypothetical protein